MKKVSKLFCPVLVFLLLLVGCSSAACTSERTEPVIGDTAPMITINGRNYVAPHMPVDELPEGYSYIGVLSEENANKTGLEGCRIYAVMTKSSFTDFYLYQECGTPIGENMVDSTQRQWAYVQWILVE